MEYTDFINLTDSLLFSSEFEELRQAVEFKEPNLWQILGISRRETYVSSFLAWLLDPKANHSLGDSFFKEFIVIALRKQAGKHEHITPVHIKLRDCKEFKVATETWLNKRRCDILILSDQTGNIYAKTPGFLCLIENKVGARESPDQTVDYYSASFSIYPQDDYPQRIYIFLSPYGDLPKCDAFIPLSYQDVLVALDAVLFHHQLNNTEEHLILQFKENILRGITMDQKVIDLAQSLYDQYSQLFEFVFDNVERKGLEITEERERSGWDNKSWFFNVGETAESGYRWEDCLKYSFLCAGGAPRYRKIMERFKQDDILYAYVSGKGYVGVGRVIKTAKPFSKAQLPDGTLLKEQPLAGKYDGQQDDDFCDWIVLVEWEAAVPKENAVREGIVTPSTAGRILDYRQEIMRKVFEELKARAL